MDRGSHFERYCNDEPKRYILSEKHIKPSLHQEAREPNILLTELKARDGNYILKDWDHQEYDVKKQLPAQQFQCHVNDIFRKGKRKKRREKRQGISKLHISRYENAGLL